MTPVVDPDDARQFALEVVERLRSAGYEAFWAGGCVRDQLLGRIPKDYDVATSAVPDQIRALFGHRHTLPLGAAFGVITVLGKRSAGPIEVATFRRDTQYSDGRHPDGVVFSTAEEDAQRRDFTINALFYDPLAERVLDFVGGQQDLHSAIVRAVRDPRERFAEDKLRMLRAVRFATTFNFAVEPATFAAIQELATEIVIISAERIAAEMRRMLVHSSRRRAVEMLHESGLLTVILPEAARFHPQWSDDAVRSPDWSTTLRILERLHQPTFAVGLAALIRELGGAQQVSHVEPICRRWRLSNAEMDVVGYVVGHEQAIRNARELDWSRLQPLLVSPHVAELLNFGEAVADVIDGTTENIEYCRERLRLPPHELDPAPFLNGNDLARARIPPGPIFRQLLEAVRIEQLEGRIANATEALQFALELWRK